MSLFLFLFVFFAAFLAFVAGQLLMARIQRRTLGSALEQMGERLGSFFRGKAEKAEKEDDS